jgi:hypothetical protein
MTELVRGEATPDTSPSCRSMKVGTDTGWRPGPAAGRAAQHAEERSHGKRGAQLQPRSELLPRPSVHPHFASFAALCCVGNYVALRAGGVVIGV